ncbi:zinc finger protein-domain-containing protein [Colletotrichum cereale]|nr:zinc finger protein-domain-containing protein [Colletotrichum cereale]
MQQGSGDGAARLPKPSDRRPSVGTVASSRAVSLELAMMANLALEDKLEEDALGEPLESCLKRMLSTRTVVSTSSSFAQRQQAAVGTDSKFREIGTGSIGKVFEHPGTTFAYKLPMTDQTQKLWNNYIIHKRIETSFQSLPYFDGQVEIPRCFCLVPRNQGVSPKPRHVLCMERIFPLPRPVRHALIEKYCPPHGRERMRSDAVNKDCLVRPYLGRVKFGQGGLFFSLRNFKLHADQVQELGVVAADLYTGMAHALAVLHWDTKIDGNDIEFVIGSSPVGEQTVRGDINLAALKAMHPQTSTYEVVTHTGADFTKRVTTLWMIDFDDCHDITMDEAGINKAVSAFLETNHYCPKPNTGNSFIESLWKDFSTRYILYSRNILDIRRESKLNNLPAMFIEKITQRMAARKEGSLNAGPSGGPRGGSDPSKENRRQPVVVVRRLTASLEVGVEVGVEMDADVEVEVEVEVDEVVEVEGQAQDSVDLEVLDVARLSGRS